MQFTVTRTVEELTDQELLTEYELALTKQATPVDEAVASIRAEVLSRMAKRWQANQYGLQNQHNMWNGNR